VRYFWNNRSQLQLRDGILYYLWEEPICPRLLLVAPKILQQEILENCHCKRLSGHMGQNKTLERLKRYAIWYKMQDDCKIFVQKCSVCSFNKKSSKKAKAELGQYISGVPMGRVHIDLLGPLPTTRRNNKYVLMIMDQFTKWLECFPLPNQSAETVAKTTVDRFISRFGCPLEIHTDQGKNVDGNLMRRLCDLLQITKTRTTPYHPASNGQVERANRTILQAIRCFLNKSQADWDLHLQQLAGAIRATENRQTGYTANFMMLGREVSHPLDIMLGTTSSLHKEPSEYIHTLQDTLQKTHQIARENLQSAQRRQKRDYDLKTNQQLYNIGDVVLKTNSASKIGQSRKLKQPWRGPYVISDRKSPVLYKIKDKKTESVIHHDRLKLYLTTELPAWLKRVRNEVLKNEDTLANQKESEEENICDLSDLSALFDHQDDNYLGSDTLGLDKPLDHTGLMSDNLTLDNDGDNRNTASDILMLNDIVSNLDLASDTLRLGVNSRKHTNLGSDILTLSNMLNPADPASDILTLDKEVESKGLRPDITDLQSLGKPDMDLDETFVYDLDSQLTNHGKRTHRLPRYLADFDLQDWDDD